MNYYEIKLLSSSVTRSTFLNNDLLNRVWSDLSFEIIGEASTIAPKIWHKIYNKNYFQFYFFLLFWIFFLLWFFSVFSSSIFCELTFINYFELLILLNSNWLITFTSWLTDCLMFCFFYLICRQTWLYWMSSRFRWFREHRFGHRSSRNHM